MKPIAAENPLMHVNRLLRQLCDLTGLCLDTVAADEPERLADLLCQRQTLMDEIDRIQEGLGFPADNQTGSGRSGRETVLGHAGHQTMPASPCGQAAYACADGHGPAVERRDLLHLLRSLDQALVSQSSGKLEHYRTGFQKSLSQPAGPSASRSAATGRLFSRIG